MIFTCKFFSCCFLAEKIGFSEMAFIEVADIFEYSTWVVYADSSR